MTIDYEYNRTVTVTIEYDKMIIIHHVVRSYVCHETNNYGE